MPMISVIVPVYKAEKYIESCVRSILAQTYGDFELILVEDGSPDRSGEICDALAETDTRIRVIHKENGGAATARNAGLDVARGEFIAFIDGDDCVHPKYLEFLLTLQRETGADIAAGHYTFFDSDAKPCFEELNISSEIERVTLLKGENILDNFYDYCYRMTMISVCMKLYKQSIFDEVRLPAGSIEEDSIVLPYIIERCDLMARSDCKLYYWRTTPGSVSRSGLRKESFHRIDISYQNAEFFINRGNRRQADHFKRMCLRRTMRYYYRVQDEKPELMNEFTPYLQRYKKNFLRYYLAKGMCLRERIAYSLFLVWPSKARSFLEQVFGPKDL